MSQLIHVGTNKIPKKEYKNIKEEVMSLFDKNYTEPYSGYFQHIPLEDLDPKLQKTIIDTLREDVQEYAFNYLTTRETQGPLIGLSGIGNVEFVRQSAYNEAFDDPIWEFEAKGIQNMSSSITAIWHLNTIEKNGELEFHFQGMKVQPQNKEVVMFPSYYTHSHRFIPANEEKLFLITTFYLGG